MRFTELSVGSIPKPVGVVMPSQDVRMIYGRSIKIQVNNRVQEGRGGIVTPTVVIAYDLPYRQISDSINSTA